MEKKSKQEFSLESLSQYIVILLLALAIVVVLAIFVVFVYPSSLETYNSWKIIPQNKEQIRLLKNKFSVLSTLNEGDLRDSIDRTQILLPVENEIPEIIGYFNEQSSKTAVNMGDFEVGQSSLGGSGELKIDIEVAGLLQNLFEFNNALIDSGRLMTINSLELDFTSEPDALSQNFELVLISEKFPESIGEISESLPIMNQQEKELLTRIQSIQRQETSTVAPEFTPRENPFSP